MSKYHIYHIAIPIILSIGCHSISADKHLKEISTLPTFRFTKLDSSTRIITDSLSLGHAKLFVYFNSDCDHCQRQAMTLLKHADQLTELQVYFITADSLNEVRKFASKFKFSDHRNFIIGTDYDYTFYAKYLPEKVPFLAIYNRTNKLVRIYEGETNIHSIVSSIQ